MSSDGNGTPGSDISAVANERPPTGLGRCPFHLAHGTCSDVLGWTKVVPAGLCNRLQSFDPTIFRIPGSFLSEYGPLHCACPPLPVVRLRASAKIRRPGPNGGSLDGVP